MAALRDIVMTAKTTLDHNLLTELERVERFFGRVGCSSCLFLQSFFPLTYAFSRLGRRRKIKQPMCELKLKNCTCRLVSRWRIFGLPMYPNFEKKWRSLSFKWRLMFWNSRSRRDSSKMQRRYDVKRICF